MAVERPRLSYGWSLSLAMVATIAIIGAMIFLDEQRDFAAALLALQDEQVALATAMAADFEGRLKRMDEQRLQASPEALTAALPQLLGGAIELRQPGLRVILVSVPGQAAFIRANGRPVRSEQLRQLLARGESRAMLAREHGPSFGLPERLVAVGMRRLRGATNEAWGIAVLASAERLRARERQAQTRFILGVALATLVVGGFGGLLLRDQKRKLALSRELEVAAFQRERERLLAEADKMATLAALSSGVAHQIATPLGTITARVEQVLAVVENDARAAAALRVVHEQVQRIEHTIRALLSLARGNRPSLVRTDPRGVVRAALSAVKHRFDSGSVQLELSPLPDLSPISCDPPLIEQALVNLLLNALEASEAGGRVRVWVDTQQTRNVIVVEDDGHGIAQESAAHVGEPFYTTKSDRRGTGLGLAIAQEIVSHHGGRLYLEARTDQRGTRASIELPAA